MSTIAILLALMACSPVQIHVSPTGNDSASGRKNNPLATAAAAVQKAAEYGDHDMEIIFSDGVYPVTETVFINGSDFSGTLKLRAARNARPVFSAEKAVGGWEMVSDARALSMLSCPEKVLQADLKAAGLTDFGNPIGDSDRFDLYCNGKRQILAMWPNEGFTYAGKALGTTRLQTWLGETCDEPFLEYADPHIDSWAEEPDPCAHGYWCYDWYDMYNPLEIDKAGRKMTIGGDHSIYGYNSGCRFRGVNLLSEIDMPGEYWVDREQGLIFWYAPENFDGTGTTVSCFAGDYLFVLDNCTNLTIEGLEMCGSRGGALSVTGGSGLLVKDCTFRRFAKDVVKVDGGHGHKFSHCLLTELGCAGFSINGGVRDTLEPAGFEVSDCTIETLSLYRKTYQPCILFGGCGLLVSHNLFRDCPSSALRLDGNDIIVEYNIFEDLVKESDDQGGIDIFNDYTFRGIDIRHNYFHNIGDPKDHIAAAVRFDDRISGMNVECNIFNHCGSSGFGGVQIHGGQDNLIHGNLFYDCTFAVTSSPWDLETWNDRNEKEREKLGLTDGMDALTPMGELFLQRYPDISHMLDETLLNRNYVKGNLMVRTASVLNRDDSNYVLEDNTIIPGDDDRGFGHWMSDENLAAYGIGPFGFDSMGPRSLD